MSKAEDRALEAYPSTPNWDERITCMYRGGFIKGYHQAEKDLELKEEDIRTILDCFIRYKMEIGWNKIIDEDDCAKEILKRFKDFKERKEK